MNNRYFSVLADATKARLGSEAKPKLAFVHRQRVWEATSREIVHDINVRLTPKKTVEAVDVCLDFMADVRAAKHVFKIGTYIGHVPCI